MMPKLVLLGPAAEAAGRREDDAVGTKVGDIVVWAADRYGPDFNRLLATCQIWVNGERCGVEHPVGSTDEVAVVPPFSGG